MHCVVAMDSHDVKNSPQDALYLFILIIAKAGQHDHIKLKWKLIHCLN
jgi:hypothetical protein